MRQVFAGFRQAAKEDWPILAGTFGVWSALVVLLALRHVDGLQVASYANNLLLYVLALVLMTLWVAGSKLYRARPESPIRFLIELTVAGNWARSLTRGIPVLIGLIVFMPVFSTMKSAIPMFHPFTWDPTWIALDRAIHGADVWRLLQPLLGFPIVTSALSLAYVLWFFLIYSGSVYFCFLTPDPELRARYFITLFATWTICGVVLATLFSSVGPCFVGPLLGDHTFDAQMAYLRAANEHYPVLTLRAQDFLLASQLEADHGLGGGISAMPSMHVAMALLFALAVSKISRAAAIGGFAFFLTIQIASVHLASHYAVDGYLSIAVTLAIWKLSKPLARRITAGSAKAPERHYAEAEPAAI